MGNVIFNKLTLNRGNVSSKSYTLPVSTLLNDSRRSSSASSTNSDESKSSSTSTSSTPRVLQARKISYLEELQAERSDLCKSYREIPKGNDKLKQEKLAEIYQLVSKINSLNESSHSNPDAQSRSTSPSPSYIGVNHRDNSVRMVE